VHEGNGCRWAVGETEAGRGNNSKVPIRRTNEQKEWGTFRGSKKSAKMSPRFSSRIIESNESQDRG
jgi:hypothetical protein